MANTTQHLAPASKPATTFEEAMARVRRCRLKMGRMCETTAGRGFGRRTRKPNMRWSTITGTPMRRRSSSCWVRTSASRGIMCWWRASPIMDSRIRSRQEQSKLTAEDMAALTQETVDIAQGLGKKVTVAGLSAGGVMAAWAAQFRADVDLAVVMGPAFGLPFVPSWVSSTSSSA